MTVPRITLAVKEIYFAREFNHVCWKFFFFHVLVNVNQTSTRRYFVTKHM